MITTTDPIATLRTTEVGGGIWESVETIAGPGMVGVTATLARAGAGVGLAPVDVGVGAAA